MFRQIVRKLVPKPANFMLKFSQEMPSPSGNMLLFGYIFFSFELFTYGIVLAIVFLNLAVIWPTKILHANLKRILITQSGAVMFFILVRSVVLVQKFTLDNPFAPANRIIQSILFFNAIFRHLLGPVLIIERFFATVSTHSYENYSKIRFTFTWFSITFIIAFVNTVTNGQSWTFTELNLITQTMSTVISLFEYLLIIVIRNYNRRRYINQFEEASPKNYHIGQRYQVSENVKTATQLSPTFLCLFLANLSSNFFVFVTTFGIVTESNNISLTFAFGIWIDVFLSAATELTIMTHHPLLKRRLIINLKKILRMNQNHIGTVPTNTMELAPSTANPTNGGDEMDAHFKMLQQLWNK